MCRECFDKLLELSKAKRTRPCKYCNTIFTAPSTSPTRVTCSTICSARWLSFRQQGSKSHLWKGGKTSDAMIIRCSNAYTEWRRAVFERDNYKCVLCGNGGQLNAHHIKSFSKYPDLRLYVNNGMTLCCTCHSIIDPIAKNLIGRKLTMKRIN